MTIPKYKILTQVILYELYSIITDGRTEGRDLEQIHEKFFNSEIPKNYLKKICNELLKDGYISEEKDAETQFDANYFAITGKGIAHVESQLDILGSPIGEYAQNGKAWLFGESHGIEENSKYSESLKVQMTGQEPSIGAPNVGKPRIFNKILPISSPGMVTEAIDVDRFDWLLLGLMLEAALSRQNEGYLSIESLHARDPLHTVESEIANRLITYAKLGLVVKTRMPFRGGVGVPEKMYRLSVEGIHFVIQNSKTVAEQEHGLTADHPDRVVDTLDRIWTWYASAIGHPHDKAWELAPDFPFSSIPASDRVVSLDHNSPDYKNAVSSIEKVIQEFREDHHLDNEFGHEKGALLKTLEAGRELLNDSMVNVRVSIALIVEPLKRIIQKYDQVFVGALAATALSLILKLLGLG